MPSETHKDNKYAHLLHSQNSLFELRTAAQIAQYEKEKALQMEADKKRDDEPFQIPRKFSSNFQKLVHENKKKR